MEVQAVDNSDSLRAVIGAAIEEAERPDAGGAAPDPAQPVRPAEETATPTTESRTDGRAANGRFAPRKAGEGTEPGQPVDTARVNAPAPAVPAAPAAPDLYAKPPQSWKPGAREAWGSLPPDVRAEVHRREREAHHAVQQGAQARQVYEHIGQLSQRYAPALQAEGVDVMRAAANLMDLSSRLRFGTKPEKAALAARIIRSYDVDVEALADALDAHAQQRQQGQPAPQQGNFQDPRVDQLLAQLGQAKQERQQRAAQQMATEVETFGASKEFFEDVREDMADMMEVANKRGIDLSMDQAYERCCSLRPEIAKVLEARKNAAAAGNAVQSTQRARAASSSVRGTPSGVSTPGTGNLRDDIESAIEQVGGR